MLCSFVSGSSAWDSCLRTLEQSGCSLKQGLECASWPTASLSTWLFFGSYSLSNRPERRVWGTQRQMCQQLPTLGQCRIHKKYLSKVFFVPCKVLWVPSNKWVFGCFFLYCLSHSWFTHTHIYPLVTGSYWHWKSSKKSFGCWWRPKQLKQSK